MKFQRLMISGYGGLKDVKLELKDGLNIIYGPNESGKSTIQAFIKAMLFSQRRGKSSLPSDKERFRPWYGGTYGGALDYELDDSRGFRVWRDFNTGEVKVFDSALNDVTDAFSHSRGMGPLFAEEHLGVDFDLFTRTCFVQQLGVRPGVDGGKALIEKLANILETGSERSSYARAKEILEKTLLDEVGTERTTEKPLNKVQESIKRLESEKSNLENRLRRVMELEISLKECRERECKLGKGKEFAFPLTGENQVEDIAAQAFNPQGLKYQLEQKMRELEEIDSAIPAGTAIFDDEVAESLTSIGKRISTLVRFRSILTSGCAAVVFAGAAMTVVSPKLWIAGLVSFLVGLLVFLYGRKKNAELTRLQEELSDILDTAGVHSISKYIEKKKEMSFIAEKRSLITESISLIRSQLDMESDRDLQVKINGLETEIRILTEQTSKLVTVEEELLLLQSRKNEIEELGYCIRKALESLEEAGREIKEGIEPHLSARFCEACKRLTGRYKHVRVNPEDSEIRISLQDGKVVTPPFLSDGTTDQIYLALRLTMAGLLSANREIIPLMLDEVLSQYDDERLEMAAEYIKEMSACHQVILFTCREHELYVMSQEIPRANIIRLSRLLAKEYKVPESNNKD